MIAMIDMGLGNLRSVENAFRVVGAEVAVVSSPEHLRSAHAIILPGVGAFEDGMHGLQQQNLVDPIREIVARGKTPLLGICLGMQLLADDSEEHGHHGGLGLVPGSVKRIDPPIGLRVPNMGWSEVVSVAGSSILFREMPLPQSFYFAHSYHLVCKDEASVSATLDYGGKLCAAIERGNIFGVQFHPEKSQDPGLSVLDAFVRHVRSLESGTRFS